MTPSWDITSPAREQASMGAAGSVIHYHVETGLGQGRAEEGLNDGSRVGQARRFYHHAVVVELSVANQHAQLVKHPFQLGPGAGGEAADAAILQHVHSIRRVPFAASPVEHTCTVA